MEATAIPAGVSERRAGRAFVVGHRKSGSTWLLHLLSLHPDVRGVQETHAALLAVSDLSPTERVRRLYLATPFGGRLRDVLASRLAKALPRWATRRRPLLALPAADRPAQLRSLPLRFQLQLKRSLSRLADGESFCSTLFDCLEEQLSPRRLLVEKSPSHVDHLPRLRGWFPDAKLISIHRDGRDAVVSDRFFAARYEPGRPWTVAASALQWRRRLELEREFCNRDELFTCSYEELHRDGQGVVKRLLAFLELPDDPSVVERLVASTSFRAQSGRSPGQEARGAFLRKGVMGDWRNHLRGADKETFKRVAGDLLIELGYERDDRW